jgi:hypothetical protein
MKINSRLVDFTAPSDFPIREFFFSEIKKTRKLIFANMSDKTRKFVFANINWVTVYWKNLFLDVLFVSFTSMPLNFNTITWIVAVLVRIKANTMRGGVVEKLTCCTSDIKIAGCVGSNPVKGKYSLLSTGWFQGWI